MSSFLKNSDDQIAFEQICQIATELTGILFSENDLSMLSSRLSTRMMKINAKSLTEYYSYYLKNIETEKPQLISLVTTHYTYFFREFIHFDFLIKSGLNQLISVARKRSDKTIQIWSSACSSGEEAYSLALFFNYHLNILAPEINFKIYGTDIDPVSVEKASNGVFRNESLAESPALYINQQVQIGKGSATGFSKIKDSIRNKCIFSTANLFNIKDYKPDLTFDLIFCRNVFIYFKEPDIKVISTALFNRLHSTGYLVTGVTESLEKFKFSYKAIDTTIYSKLLESTHTLNNKIEISQPKSVLCIDDSPTILSLLKNVISENTGFSVSAVAKNGQEALDILRNKNFDVITLDLNMPILDGVGFMKNYKGTTPVLIISAVSRDDLKMAQVALSLGAKDYVEKPSLTNIEHSKDQIISKLKSISNKISITNTVTKTENIKSQNVEILNSSQQIKKVLLVDDSMTILNILENILKADSRLSIQAKISDPRNLENEIIKSRPDVITLDINMPHIDGLTALKMIQKKYQIPTVMISAMNKEESNIVFQCLENGACDFIQKPTNQFTKESKEAIIERIFAASVSKNVELTQQHHFPVAKINNFNIHEKIILIGASTGGTEAIKNILLRLPAQIPPIIIAQHIPEFFSASLAQHLNELVPFQVKEAENNEEVQANYVYIAPGGKQLKFIEKNKSLYIEINSESSINHHKPSVDFMFNSILTHTRFINPKNIVAVLLTGMGTDGAASLKKLYNAGVHTIAQDEASSVVFGMPKEAIKIGAAKEIKALGHIADAAIQALEINSTKQFKKTI